MKTVRAIAALWSAFGLVACSGDAPSGATLELDVSYPPGLALDHLVLAGDLPLDPPRSVRADVPSPPRLLDDAGESLVLALPEGMSGTVELVVEGWSQSVLRARQTVQVDPSSGAATVRLSLVDTSTCTEPPCGPVEACGDGVVAASEACDDGDLDAADGCNARCEIESGWICAGEPSVCEPDCADGCESCGDGVIDATEGCDDSDRVSSDGCNVICQVEVGWSCTGEPSVCAPICGDGLVVEGEACDDMGNAPGDGCSATCEVETGFACAGEPSECGAVCGDGRVLGDETCDDSDADPGDGCSAICQTEEGFICQGAPSRCDAVCGDGLVRGDETCDDDGRRNGDGCNNKCEVEAGYVCVGEPSVCTVGNSDAGVDAGTVSPDAEVVDGSEADAGVVDPDSGVDLDAGVVDDSGVVADAAVVDAGSVLPADAWVFVPSAPLTYTAGQCQPVALQRQDSAGQPSSEAVSRTVQFTVVSGQAALHSDPGCSTQIMATSFAAGVAERTFYLRGDIAGGLLIRASSTGLTPGELAGTIVGAEPTIIAVAGGPTSLDWYACGGTPVQVELRDVFGNLATNAADHTITLTTTPLGAVLMSNNASCNSPTSEVVIASGSNSVSRYLLPLRSGTIAVHLTANGLAAAQGQLPVNDAAGSCATCPGSGPCAQSGSGTTSNVLCDRRCACQLDCGPTANDCRPTCGDDSMCDVDCTGRARCEASCGRRSQCIISCDGTPECDRIDCDGTASCMLDCGSSASCSFRTCGAGQMTCPNNVVVCNRACP